MPQTLDGAKQVSNQQTSPNGRQVVARESRKIDRVLLKASTPKDCAAGVLQPKQVFSGRLHSILYVITLIRVCVIYYVKCNL